MRVLVTGGAGFIGSHLCEFLAARQVDVVCMDNLVTGSVENLEPLRSAPGFTFVRQDVTEYLAVEGSLDWVLHLASPASPRDYLELPIQTLKVGALGTHRRWGSPWRRARSSSWRRRRRSTAIRSSTRSARTTGATSTRSGHAGSTTRPSASPRP